MRCGTGGRGVTRALAEIGMERGTGRSQARSSAGNAGDLMGRRWWRGCRLVREAGPTLMAVVALLAALTASGHEDPQMIPDGSDPVVRWYQPPGTPLVADWDVEMTSLEPGAMPSIFPAEAVPDESCWALHVDTEEPVRVRVRAFQNGVVSAWSDYTLVPEPGTAALAKDTGFTRDKVEQLRQITNLSVSLDAPLLDDGDLTLGRVHGAVIGEQTDHQGGARHGHQGAHHQGRLAPHAERRRGPGDQRHGEHDLEPAGQEHLAPQCAQPLDGQLETDLEEQEDHAQLGEVPDTLGIVDQAETARPDRLERLRYACQLLERCDANFG